MSVQIDAENEEVKETMTLRTSGDSTVLTIPPAILREAGLGAGDDVDICLPFDKSEIKLRENNDDD